MPSWLLIAVSAYLLMALSQVIDKALLNVIFRNSRAYAALVGLLGLLVFLLLPWTTGIISLPLFLLAFVGGACFIGALVPFLSALQGDQATRVIPLVGALVPLATFAFESIFLGAVFRAQDIVALALLVVGAVVLTLSKSTGRRSWSALAKGSVAAILFAASFVASKYLYTQTTFLTGFVWMRLGGLLVSAWLLAQKPVRAELRRLWQTQRAGLLGGYLGNQVVSGAGFFLQGWAISKGTATLVSAVQGVQYAVLVGLVMIASRIRPGLLGEEITFRILLEKLTAIACIAAGLFLLAI
jgi:drug/metabolite transporter (DMT)-like permease